MPWACIRKPSATSVQALALAFCFYLLLLSLEWTQDFADGELEKRLRRFIDQETKLFISSMPSLKQDFATPWIQGMLNCAQSGQIDKTGGTAFSNGSCTPYTPSWNYVPNASTRICEHLAGKRIVFVGPLTTYHLHDIWLETLEAHEGHSLYCPGAEYCIFHHICIPGRNESSHMDGRKKLFPSNSELRETQSSVLQYILSTSLVAHTDEKNVIYTRPVIDPRTGVRMRNHYWLRKAQKAHVLVLGHAPIPPPPSTYARYFKESRRKLYGRMLLSPWQNKYHLQDELVTLGLNATRSVFLPSLRDAILAIRSDPEILRTLIIWHGHWALAQECTNAGLPKHVPRIQQFWKTLGPESVDPWTFYYNLQGKHPM